MNCTHDKIKKNLKRIIIAYVFDTIYFINIIAAEKVFTIIFRTYYIIIKNTSSFLHDILIIYCLSQNSFTKYIN